MKVLITGGAGYIGSTVASALKDSGHVPIILDSLVKGQRSFAENNIFYKGDIADKQLLEKVFKEHPEIQFTIHCAALIVVPESVENPYQYYTENVSKSVELFKNLKEIGCYNIVFSSSASIYGDADGMVTEESRLNPQSPYARTKYMMEMVLEDFCRAYNMKGIALRYFNPIGADPNMRTGSYLKNPSHLLGKIFSAAMNRSEVFKITGTDYETRDGSGIRDYIHVWDLAMAHVKAIENFDTAFAKADENAYLKINLGTGKGVTVRELVSAFEKVYGSEIRKEEALRRPGDVVGAFANAGLAENLIDWRAKLTIEQGIVDALKWNKIWDNN
jgi:UDP-glucose 4-epimerase